MQHRFAARQREYGSKSFVNIDFYYYWFEDSWREDLRGRGRPCLRLRDMGVGDGMALWMWMRWKTLSARGACLLRPLRTGLDPSMTRPPDRARYIPVS